MSEIEAERNLYKGKYRALLKLISRTRNKLVHVTDHIEDEGDRVYFGSTNDADVLKALYREMMSWIWDATDETNRMKADPYATIRDLRARIAVLEAENQDLRSGLYLVGVIEERERLRRENERLRKVLRPFAEAANHYSNGKHRPPEPDDFPCQGHLQVKHLRAAKSALEPKP